MNDKTKCIFQFIAIEENLIKPSRFMTFEYLGESFVGHAYTVCKKAETFEIFASCYINLTALNVSNE